MPREVKWPHPGEILMEEWLAPMGISQYALAKAIDVPPRRINEIVKGLRGITADTALRLAAFFGTDAQSWINLQAQYDVEMARDALAGALAKIKRHVVAAAIEADAGRPVSGLRKSLAEAKAGKFSAVHVPGKRKAVKKAKAA